MSTQAYSPGLAGVIAGETDISFVNPDRQSLMYRGYDIEDLATHSTFEETAYLMIYGKLPNKAEYEQFLATLQAEAELPDNVIKHIRQFPKNANPMDLLRAGVSLMALQDPDVTDGSHDSNVRKAVRLMAQFPALITYSYRISRGQEIVRADKSLSHAANFIYMLTGKRPDEATSKLFNTTLIAYADHGFNASTFCGRVTTSTLSDLHSGIVSAIGTLKGSLHGGANEEAMKMMLEIGSVDNAKTFIMNALETKRKIMGFGHRAYKSGDPRARLLFDLGRTYCEAKGQGKWSDMAEIVRETMIGEKNIFPNVDFPTAYIYYVMDLPIEIYTPMFAAARIVGWSSHIIEQLDNNRLIRPKAIYTGPNHNEYVPMAQR